MNYTVTPKRELEFAWRLRKQMVCCGWSGSGPLIDRCRSGIASAFALTRLMAVFYSVTVSVY